jgi:hypothetical protein
MFSKQRRNGSSSGGEKCIFSRLHGVCVVALNASSSLAHTASITGGEKSPSTRAAMAWPCGGK